MAHRPPAVPDPDDGIAHGTGGGVPHCRARYGTGCVDCRGYQALAQNRYRATRAGAEAAARDAARDRALRVLARRHPGEFEQILRDELAAGTDQLPDRRSA
ncbi:hypothetical protein [Microcystis phage Mwe-JY05]